MTHILDYKIDLRASILLLALGIKIIKCKDQNLHSGAQHSAWYKAGAQLVIKGYKHK